jgi:four helix bundle protein
MGFKFEKLDVWHKSVELSYRINKLVINFPKEEMFVLSSQLKRSADSISLNIAEGSTGQSNAEFNRFLGYAIRSAIEFVSGLYLAKSRGLLDKEDFNELYQEAEKIVIMIQALRKVLK